MMYVCKKWLWFFVLIGVWGCGAIREEVVPVELATQASKLVVDCFIAPQDSVFTAKVSRSRPILDDKVSQKVEVTDATVTLSDGKLSVKLPYNSRLNVYIAKKGKLSIKAGSSYTLTVQTPDGNRVRATTTVPANVALKSVKLDSSVNGSEQNYRVMASWQNRSNTYYRMKGLKRGIARSISVNSSYSAPEPIVFTMADNAFGLVAASTKDGNLEAEALLGDGTLKKKYRTTQITLSLLHVDAAYYRYHLALDAQMKAADNPFAEAVVIPTNIQGGLGCFGSYNQSTSVVLLK